MIKYAVIVFEAKTIHPLTGEPDWDDLDIWIDETGFLDVKEAEKDREDLLKRFPQLEPQNAQVVSYKI